MELSIFSLGLLGLIIVFALIYFRLKRLIKTNANQHILNMLTTTRMELLLVAHDKKLDVSYDPWISPFLQTIDSGVLFMEKCQQESFFDITRVKNILNKNKEPKAQKYGEFTKFILYEIPTKEFPEYRALPSYLSPIQNRINSISEYAKSQKNPFFFFITKYLGKDDTYVTGVLLDLLRFWNKKKA